MAADAPRVALFATCLVDLFRPSVGFAAVKLLRAAGCRVYVPRAQTCCGQPAYNSGDRADAKRVALQVIEAFEGADYVVVPSGSCAGTIAKHYPGLFADDPDLAARAADLAERTHELVSFLVDIMGMTEVPAHYAGTATYHHSCAGLRELGVKGQARTLLDSVEGLALRDLPDSEVCCGFGGTFCVKYPEISNHMVSDKVEAIVSTGADTLLAGDLGCLMNIAGKLQRRGHAVHVRHVAEVLAGEPEAPPIGEAGELS
ncbi:L-lactate dehydrogenase complex protein LldE [Limimonas halophila]|uniref:L-lactate dehydrogenase complex protein LldE n=1 Tax=Limimonas halophila TaxID=1082479 RepID=A0A1G7SLF4_9PROT|nr:(Fe-S)-binding protein [Limimonas halophila]SDG23917.1 L-lactate dehydrogenase complex protein LldE [Limimonas halophila]